MTTPEYDDQNSQGDDVPNWRRKLEQDAKEGREAKAALEAQMAETKKMQRELSMVRAGIDISSPLGSLFAKAYDGENDVDQIKSEYAKLLPGAEGRPQTAVDPQQQAAMQRISEAQAGGVASGGQPHDFAAELDSIPLLGENGQYNPGYEKAVLAATAAQAQREGRVLTTDNRGDLTWKRGSGAVTTPL